MLQLVIFAVIGALAMIGLIAVVVVIFAIMLSGEPNEHDCRKIDNYEWRRAQYREWLITPEQSENREVTWPSNEVTYH